MKQSRSKILIGLIAVSHWLFLGGLLLAQNQSGNPLTRDITASDPVIPTGYGRRELSSFEKYRIERAIAELSQSAEALWSQGEQDQALTLWYRQLKLIRVLDRQREISALGDIGAIAWKENRGVDVRYIAERLITLETQLTNTKSLSPEILKRFLQAYQQVGYLERAIAIQSKILKASRRADNYNLAVEQSNLEVLGELYLDTFDYQNAAKIYQTLLSQQASTQSRLALKPKKEQYLKTLIEIYDRTAQTKPGITTKKLLLEHYTATQQVNPRLKLEMAIARDYETLNQLTQAIAIYDQTWQQAVTSQRLALAGNALTRLGKLYQEQSQIEPAIATYNNLIRIQQQSYNYYDLLNTYDILGQIYLKSNQTAQARQSFKQALDLARSLNYQVQYFERQIQHIED